MINSLFVFLQDVYITNYERYTLIRYPTSCRKAPIKIQISTVWFLRKRNKKCVYFIYSWLSKAIAISRTSAFLGWVFNQEHFPRRSWQNLKTRDHHSLSQLTDVLTETIRTVNYSRLPLGLFRTNDSDFYIKI